MPEARMLRFEVVRHCADGRRLLVSRHHDRGQADRRLQFVPISPGDAIEILDQGRVVRRSRCPGPNDLPDIPF